MQTSASEASQCDSSGFGERIEELARLLGGKRELARKAGVPEASLYRALSGSTTLKSDHAARLAKAAGVRLEWLVTGEGPMREGEAPAPVRGPYKEASAQPAGWSTVPLYDVEAAAGPGAVVEREAVEAWVAFRDDWLRRKGVRPGRAAIIQVRGDSMEPLVRRGDWLLLDLAAAEREFDEGIWAVWYDGLTVKWVARGRDRGFVLRSENAVYEPIYVSRDDAADPARFRLIGLVRWMCRDM